MEYTIEELVSEIQKKSSQLKKREAAAAETNTAFATNNARSVRKQLHALACQLAKITEENGECKNDDRLATEGTEN